MDLLSEPETKPLATFEVELLREVNDASATARHASLFFMALAAYYYVTLVGISHKDLLLNTMVDLPILQVKIPQRSFAVFAPLLLVLIHFGVLLQHILLSRKVRELDKRMMQSDSSTSYSPWRLILNSYAYTQAIAGRHSSLAMRFAVHAITRIPLGIVPIMLLLLFQIIFLPYHDVFITTLHRIFLAVDVVIVFLSAGLMGYPESSFFSGLFRIIWHHPIMFAALLVFWSLALTGSLLIATIQDEYIDRKLRALPAPFTANVPLGGDATQAGRTAFFPTACLFETPSSDHWCFAFRLVFTRLARNLDVRDTSLVPNQATDQSAPISLRERNLQYARLERSDLRSVNLSNADLSDAKLNGANLSGARMIGVQLTKADLRGAHLEGSDLKEAKLDSSIAERAKLQGANLEAASLVGANLQGAQLAAANLSDADLRRANLAGADLRLARLAGAAAAGADMRDANIEGADLRVRNRPQSANPEAWSRNDPANGKLASSLWIELACSDALVNTPVLKQLFFRLGSDATDYSYSIDRSDITAALFSDDCGAARRVSSSDGNTEMKSALEALRWQRPSRAASSGR